MPEQQAPLLAPGAGDRGRCLTCRHFTPIDNGCVRNGTVTDAAGNERPMMYVYPAMRARCWEARDGQ
ncbi:conserved protein of unknown function (plasmid) [Rhodovastum atsumiense]|uniref:Uncharacterized protein n=1 Tax=Rhodovastum atsumiense TaxID=504468 RepID=A0A5M6INZ4_9PROT|nr:hypothetical protein [Rhodovastum atsumiense]KAA5609629.1 hypothetical protein F1189_22975 [Rhodovastum atsumiense]CAH2606491.1 conserved protein of unknown function [Rhodovastum atsumiense]